MRGQRLVVCHERDLLGLYTGVIGGVSSSLGILRFEGRTVV